MSSKFIVIKISYLVILSMVLSSCFGPRLNKHNPQAGNNIVPILASSQDDSIQIDLQYLLVRNSPRSWAKDAKWDEYVVKITNLTGDVVTVEKLTIIDSLGYESVHKTNRKKLIKATRQTKRRFKKAGIKIKLGNGSTYMLSKSIGSTVVGAGIGAGIASTGGVTMTAGTLTTAGGAVFVAVPAALVGGIVKIVNNSKVNNKIKERQTVLPNNTDGFSSTLLDLFYSAVPSPQKIKISYSINNQNNELIMDLPDNFKDLHYK